MTKSRVEVPDALVEAAAALVQSRTGLTFNETSRSRLVAALSSELRRAGSGRALLSALQRNPAHVESLAASTTIPESYFLREPEQFEWLRRVAIPRLRARGPHEPLTIWCAGCSRGEEPYSLAIMLREMGDPGPTRIVGSDLSPSGITRARRGAFSAWSLRTAPPAFVDRWFRRALGNLVLDRTVREAVEFMVHNLAADAFPPRASGLSRVDLIVCRNVLIYFDRATIVRVAERFLDALSPDGWLLLGVSDPPLADLTRCDVLSTGSGLAYRRPREASFVPTSAPSDWEVDGEVAAPPGVERAPIAVSRPLQKPEQPTPPAADAYAARNYVASIAEAERMVDATPDAPEGWTTLMRSQANLGDLDAARRTAAMALERLPLAADIACVSALILSAAGQDREAERVARRAVYLDHTLAVAHGILGVTLARLARHDSGARAEAVRAFENAERLLEAMPPDRPVPGGDGEQAGTLLARIRSQRALLAEARRAR